MGHDILAAREERVNLQLELQKIHKKPLLTLRVNTPGAQKNTVTSAGIFNEVEAELKRLLGDRVLEERKVVSGEGPVMIRVVDMAPEALKAASVALENGHPLGRFVDLDVYNESGECLSRTSLGHEPRCCYLCSSPAHECARSGRHGLEELLAFMDEAYLRSYKKQP